MLALSLCPGSAMQIVFIGFVSADVPARKNALPSTAGKICKSDCEIRGVLV